MQDNIKLINTLKRRPSAVCDIRGSMKYRGIRGRTLFYQTRQGVVVVTRVWGLPRSDDACGNSVFGCHIHSGSACRGNENDPFAEAGTHFNPKGCLHPYHAGDMPPLFANDGFAFSAFLSDRFDVRQIVGRTVIVHSMPDDFTTQPAGNSGAKIACGQINLLI